MSETDLSFNGYYFPGPLDKEETYRLLNEFKEGSMAAKEKIVLHNVRLVTYEIKRRFSHVPYCREDLISIGIMGLIKAINTYDKSKGFEFTTYAMRCIDNEILQFLRKLNRYQYDVSLDSVIHSSDGLYYRLCDILMDDTDFTEESDMESIIAIIRDLVQKLPNREREIIMMYFGFNNNQRYNQYEISQKLHIAQSQVSRSIIRSLKKLAFKLDCMGAIEIRKDRLDRYRKIKKIKTIYEHFTDYSKEQVDEVLSQLNDKEKEILRLRYGNDLNHPVSEKLSDSQSRFFYAHLLCKIRSMLIRMNSDVESSCDKICLVKKKNDPKK